MSWTNARGLGACALCLVAACSGTSSPADSGGSDTVDARVEAATPDAPDHPDVTAPDVTQLDAASPDVPLVDAHVTDALHPDASSTDAARPDASRPDAGPASPCGSALFCEPFDSYPAMALHDGQTFGPWRAALHTPGSTMVLDATHTVSGPRALHVHIDNAVTAGGRLFSTGTLPILAGHPTHLYGRMMMYIDPNGASVHWTFFGVDGTAVGGTPAGRHASYLISSLPRSNVNTYSFVDGLDAAGSDPYHDCWDQGTTPMPTARWACVSFEMDSVGRHLRLFLDGGATPIVTMDDHGQGCVGTVVPDDAPWYGPAIDRFYAGAWSFHDMTGPLDVWIDDVVLDTSPVACPAH